MDKIDYSKYQLKFFNILWISLFSLCFILSGYTIKRIFFNVKEDIKEVNSFERNIFYLRFFCIYESFYSFIILFGTKISNYNQQIVLTKMGILKEAFSFILINYFIFFTEQILLQIKLFLLLICLVKLLSIVVFICCLSQLDKENDLSFCENTPKED